MDLLMKILIRNLDRNTTEEELNTLFTGYGAVVECTLVMDKNSGGSKGFGFVEMVNDSDANKAIQSLNQSVLGAKRIRVKEAGN